MLALRLAFCPRCKSLFGICRRCDRGHVYCSRACSAQARASSLKQLRRRYRSTEKGRLRHVRAERRRRRRLRRAVPLSARFSAACVGDHGSSTNGGCGRTSVQPSSQFDEREIGSTEVNHHENQTLAGGNSPARATRVERCAWCNCRGTVVSLSATRGWWPRRGYRKSR